MKLMITAKTFATVSLMFACAVSPGVIINFLVSIKLTDFPLFTGHLKLAVTVKNNRSVNVHGMYPGVFQNSEF